MYHLFFATPEKVIIDEEIESLNAPGSLGYLEILSHHAPLITVLQAGVLTIDYQNKKRMLFAISGGFLEVSFNQATLLADTAERSFEIDVARAEAAFARAERRLLSQEEGLDIPRAHQALLRAKNRLKTAQSLILSSR